MKYIYTYVKDHVPVEEELSSKLSVIASSNKEDLHEVKIEKKKISI